MINRLSNYKLSQLEQTTCFFFIDSSAHSHSSVHVRIRPRLREAASGRDDDVHPGVHPGALQPQEEESDQHPSHPILRAELQVSRLSFHLITLGYLSRFSIENVRNEMKGNMMKSVLDAKSTIAQSRQETLL